jgi:hypothetical protein
MRVLTKINSPNSSKATPGADHTLCLDTALTAMTAVASHVNETTRRTDALAAQLDANVKDANYKDFRFSAQISASHIKCLRTQPANVNHV